MAETQDKKVVIANILKKLEKLDETGLLLMDNGAQLLVVKQQLDKKESEEYQKLIG